MVMRINMRRKCHILFWCLDSKYWNFDNFMFLVAFANTRVIFTELSFRRLKELIFQSGIQKEDRVFGIW